jgi:hypothetical protein
MNANDKIAEPRIGDGSLVRPRYTPGLMLQDDDLTAAVTYTRELNRLLFRSLLGCGVICGLEVVCDDNCGKLTIAIAPGLALDCCGDPVALAATQTFVLDPSCKPLPDSMCIVLRGHDRSCLPRSSACDTGCTTTRINEGWELRILTDCPECGCGCTPPKAVDVRTAAPAAAAALKTSKAANSAKAAKKPVAATAVLPAASGAAAASLDSADCRCIDLNDPAAQACYGDHYAAKCSCCTDCEWVTLARVYLDKAADGSPKHYVDHSVRRLIRPVLMRDPVAAADAKP